MKIFLISIFCSAISLAESWSDVQAACDRGASFSVEKTTKYSRVTISLGKSNSEEIFLVLIDKNNAVSRFAHINRFYFFDNDKNINANLSSLVEISEIVSPEGGGKLDFRKIGEWSRDFSDSDVESLFERCKNLTNLVINENSE